MNPLYIKNEIQNHLDRRLIDCFCEQNKSNQWLQVRDVASWVFETNNPNAFQKNYTLRKLNSLVGLRDTAAFKQSAFESSYDPGIEYKLVYRLKDPKAYCKQDLALSTNTEVEEFPF